MLCSRCAQFPDLAPGCIMVPDPKDPSCCQAPQCTTPTNPNVPPTGVFGQVQGNSLTPTPTPWDGLSPTIGSHLPQGKGLPPPPPKNTFLKGKMFILIWIVINSDRGVRAEDKHISLSRHVYAFIKRISAKRKHVYPSRPSPYLKRKYNYPTVRKIIH